MILFLACLHILTAVLIVTFVLIQDAKGGGAFGMGGGGSNQILSSTGAASFLVNITRTLAVIFAATSIGLTYLTTSHSNSVVDDYTPAAAAPKTPGTATAGAAAAPATEKAGKADKANTPAEKDAAGDKSAAPANTPAPDKDKAPDSQPGKQ
jgi:preprotein translocase subunit SecG